MAESSSAEWRAEEQASDVDSIFDGDLPDVEHPDSVMFGDDLQHSEDDDEHLALPDPLLELSNSLSRTEDPQPQGGLNAQLQQIPLAQQQPVHQVHPNGYPVMLPHLQPAGYTLEEIAHHRGRCSENFVPLFVNMAHANSSYENWLALGNVAIRAGSNDRENHELRLDNVALIKELFHAFRNTNNTFEFQKELEKRKGDKALENPDEEFPKSINKGTDEVNDYDLQTILWRLLEFIHRAQEGKASLPPTYSVKTKGFGAFPSFLDRFNKVKECLTQSKLMCKDLLNGDDFISRLAWNPSAELRRKHQNSHGNSVRDVQSRTAALAINKQYITVDKENGKVFTNTGEEIGELALPRHTKALEKALEDIPTREGSTDVAKCQEKMGIKRKRTQGKPRARPAKRARAASQAAGSEASATPASDDQFPVSQPYGIEAPQLQAPQLQAPQLQAPQLQAPQLQAPQLQAPQLQAPVMQHFESNDRPSDFEFDMFAPGNAVQAPMPSVDGLQFLTYVPDQEGQSSMPETPGPEAPIDDEVQGSMNANGNNPQVPQDPEIHIGSYSERLDGITMPDGTLRHFTEETSGGECLPQYMRSDFNPAGHNYGAPMNDPQAHSHALLDTYSTCPQGPWSSESHNHQAVLNEWYGNRNAGPYSHLVMEARQPTRSHRVRSTNSVTGDRHAVPPNGAQQPIRSRQVRSTNPVTGDQQAVPPNGAQLLGPGSSSAGTVPHSVFYQRMNGYYVKPKSSGASGHGN
ncbi:hypothetical protein PG995_010704 [Apiospora arundinis]